MKSLATLFLTWVSFSQSLDPRGLSRAMGLESQSKGLPDLYEASISQLQQGLEKEHFTSVDLVKVHYHL